MTSITPQFGGETAVMYQKLFEQHAQPGGPWKAIRDVVERVLGPKLEGEVLDIASGPGEPAVSTARLFPKVNVTCTDIAQDMVDKARVRGNGLQNIRFELVDAQDLSMFADNSFDVVTCCYGFMFCPDKQRAFTEVGRVLKPGGTLVTTYWRNVVIMKVSRAAMEAVLGAPPPTPDLNPNSLSEPGLVENYLTEAGFDAATYELSESEYPMALEEQQFARKAALLPVWQKLLEMDAQDKDKDVLELAMSAADKFFVEHGWINPDGSVTCPGNRFAMIVARVPN
ncbi:Ubiquinone/menaquinone biosynthesis C-methyltransferase UbiE [Porphyridium purpureum]|uniref:Ubiquinone/menaquinone biosynthesis C-methyltransferase UbiE n=1 Tax=Porphyridium purpureum TaxID=35688 RepID=A0A5J4YHK9_PORPP|nr:Ubiquinone/menaquinone biosynthesis C-methyltransferase UbiE [Porphyridium purpureum]|eukprot:POR6500..scf289_17